MKSLVFGIIFILLILAISHTPQANVTGECSDCHTMHNSQGGDPMAQELASGPWTFVDDTTPNPSLLIYTCVGCHTNIGDATIDGGVPIVFNTLSPTNPLAGGNFYHVINDGDNRGHNVLNIKDAASPLWNTPPGGTALSSQLTCAGENGCHGDRSEGNPVDAIKTAHHTDDTGGITGDSVGLSYRFLKDVAGIEDGDWEQDNDPESHNEYKGATDDFGVSSTISYLCGQCHGNSGGGGFHNSVGVGSSSPWSRHATDCAIPNLGEYANYTAYSMTAPVARPNLSDLPGNPNMVRPGTDVIMCLSCHRAHGSPYYKMMRWDYTSTDLLDVLSGCIVCHTSKS